VGTNILFRFIIGFASIPVITMSGDYYYYLVGVNKGYFEIIEALPDLQLAADYLVV
jgi:hypothetical protein